MGRNKSKIEKREWKKIDEKEWKKEGWDNKRMRTKSYTEKEREKTINKQKHTK